MSKITLNGIDYAGGGSGGSSGHNYSTSEQVVGTWVDSKPIYEKTLHIQNVAYDGNWHTVPHGINDLERVVKLESILENQNEVEWYSVNAYRPTTATGIILGISGANIQYLNNWYNSANTDFWVIIRYTKTTD